MKQGVLERYREYLPVNDSTPILSLGEGDTPLVRSRAIEGITGCGELYFKLEGCNPTGSFKDRGMVVAVAKAMEADCKSIVCASTGNTSASAAAYGAYCGMSTTVLVPKGNVARGKLTQAIAYGARVALIDGSFDSALKLVRVLSERLPLVVVNSVNPHRIQGQKTAAFEIIDDLGGAPDEVFVPVGNAGNITAYWLGFTEAHAMGWASSRPKMMGVQAEGAAPIVRGKPVDNPETIASAIRVGSPASWKGALRARDESGGHIGMVSDDDIIEAYHLMAKRDGIFCEPASAASVAGLMKRARQGESFEGKRVVCIITGSGLKDPDIAEQMNTPVMEEFPAELEAVERALAFV